MATYARGADRWSVEQDGARLVITARPADGPPGEKIRKFVTAAHADVQRDRLIAEQEAAGWVLVADVGRAEPAPPAVASEPRDAELERAILASPDDPGAYAVYGDWLQQRGHPRGTLIALQLAAEAKPGDRKRAREVTAHLAAHADELVGEVGELVAADALTWRAGFVRRIELVGPTRGEPADAIAALVEHPSGRWLAEVELRDFDGDDTTRALDALADGAPAALRVLSVLTTADVPSFAAIPRLAGLRRLTVKRCGAHASELPPHAVRVLARAPASLEALHLRLRGAEAWPDLAPLFARADLGALRELGLRGMAFASDAIAALANCPWAPQLELLDLAFSPLASADVGALIAGHARCPRLREVVVSGDELDAHDLADLRAAFARVKDVRTDADDHRAELLALDARASGRYDAIAE